MQITPTVYVIVAATPWLFVLGKNDWKTRKLPNHLTLGGSVVILGYLLFAGGIPLLLNGLLGGAVAGGVLLLPFLLRAAGAGDVKFLFAGGLLAGWPAVFPMLVLTSLFGLFLGVGMQLAGLTDAARLKHHFRCAFDWRYDRAEGRKNLPERSDERCRVPFGIAIAAGIWTTLLLRVIGEYSR